MSDDVCSKCKSSNVVDIAEWALNHECKDCGEKWYINGCRCGNHLDSRNKGVVLCKECKWYKCDSCGSCNC
jgi:hypothetical protein